MLPKKAAAYVLRKRVAEKDLVLIVLIHNLNKMRPGFLTACLLVPELIKFREVNVFCLADVHQVEMQFPLYVMLFWCFTPVLSLCVCFYHGRCYTFGIGQAVCRRLILGLSAVSRGTAEFLAEGERLQPKVLIFSDMFIFQRNSLLFWMSPQSNYSSHVNCGVSKCISN